MSFQIFVFSFLLFLCISPAISENLFLQHSLDEHFAKQDAAVAIVDIKTGALLASFHPDMLFHQKQPPGSLMKAFTLCAYVAKNGKTLPHFHCPATLPSDPSGCWDRNGHGEVDAEKAVAFSCNVYFRQLAQQTSPEIFAAMLKQFGLIQNERKILSLPEDTQRKLMVGNTLEWSIIPVKLLRAYAAMYNGGTLWPPGSRTVTPPHVAMELIHRGMRRGAAEGTSALAQKEAGAPLLGKTGTSLMQKEGKINWGSTQGLWIGFYPADIPEIAVMTFVPNGRGATHAAPAGGAAIALYLKATHAR